MSAELKTPTRIPMTTGEDDRLSADTVPAQSALLVSLAVLFGVGLIFLVAIDAGPMVNLALKLIFLAILTLTLKRWTGALVLALLQANLFMLEEPGIAGLNPTASVIWVGVSLMLMACISQFRTLQDFEPHSALRLFPRLRRLQRPPRSQLGRLSAESSRRSLAKWPRTLLQLTGCALLAALLMWLVPMHPRNGPVNTVREYRLIPTGYRTIMMGVLLFLIYLPTWLVTNEVRWRSHSVAQSGVYLRGVFLKWIHRDLRMVVRRTVRLRRRKAVAVGARSKAAEADKTRAVELRSSGEEF